MDNQRELVQSVLSAMALVQNADDELLETPGVLDILRDMDDLAYQLQQVLG
jgi:hypothetical protein